jgi:lipopolysaccharide transport system permease protein
MYATPVVYPISQVPESLKWVLFLNPVSAPIELFRIYFYGVGTLSPAMIATSLAMTGIFFFLGLVTFTRNERTFIDVV